MTKEEIIKRLELLYSDFLARFKDMAEKATLAPGIERFRYECYAVVYDCVADELLETIREGKEKQNKTPL